MKKMIAIFTITLCFSLGIAAQFPRLPKFPKVDEKKTSDNKTSDSQTTSSVSNSTDSNSNSFKQTVPATTILKPTLSVRAERDQRYWKQPTLDNYWSWMPKVNFTVTGPIADASFFTVEFTTPDGKPWFSWDSEPVSVAEGGWFNVESEAVPRWQDKRSTIQTGTFGFKVTLKNNLNGTSQEMYRGNFKVNKKFAGTENPNFKNQYAFYVEQDWALPIGYVSLDTKQDANAPKLDLGMWFRGDYDSSRLNAYLFYNGKQISNTKNSDKGSGSSMKALIAQGDDKKEFYWAFWNFSFFNVRAAGSSSYPDAFSLKNNPGIYEIKVLLDDEIIRTANFTVGTDGKIVDSGIAANNGFGGMGTVIPVKVITAKEGTLNLGAWKTDAFYGNPLTGFTAQ